ncbi:hypothetical protein AMS68_007938 [Peltaster fructicola]|uniref:Nucleoporin Nup54 alpha-helical domain-containing protein n=1 Tax=Peltaster fructicola TaxID=286661 RepID=A0A6H0Y6F1_9PEZI|nr:hypothetical protein AMS68_007938 [Peltaster fructicola]
MSSIFAQTKPTTSNFFGGAQSSAAQPSLFGASTNAAQPAGGLFGASQAPAGGLFGSSTQQPAPNQGLFGQSQQQQPQQQQNNLAGALGQGLNASVNFSALDAQAQRELAQSRLQGAGLSNSVREKTVTQQLETLVGKWDPASPDTLLQTYLYNAANPAFAPFYHPAIGESEKEYETALAKKPEATDGNTWVPVLIRGLKALGERVEYQAKFVQNMQIRLHEMNNALSAIIEKHTQDLSVRIDASRRQHAAISARTLRLAVKCQVLRNRGYALDSQEESLRTTLLELEKKVLDPVFASREEEIWARMVQLRERARWLEEEGKRLGSSVNGHKVEGTAQLPADVVASARRILRDYDVQIQQLTKEVNEVHREFNEWNETRAR